MPVDYKVIYAAIAALAVLGAIAMFQNVDGYFLQLIVFIIGGLAGWMGLPQPKQLNGST